MALNDDSMISHDDPVTLHDDPMALHDSISHDDLMALHDDSMISHDDPVALHGNPMTSHDILKVLLKLTVPISVHSLSPSPSPSPFPSSSLFLPLLPSLCCIHDHPTEQQVCYPSEMPPIYPHPRKCPPLMACLCARSNKIFLHDIKASTVSRGGMDGMGGACRALNEQTGAHQEQGSACCFLRTWLV